MFQNNLDLGHTFIFQYKVVNKFNKISLQGKIKYHFLILFQYQNATYFFKKCCNILVTTKPLALVKLLRSQKETPSLYHSKKFDHKKVHNLAATRCLNTRFKFHILAILLCHIFNTWGIK